MYHSYSSQPTWASYTTLILCSLFLATKASYTLSSNFRTLCHLLLSQVLFVCFSLVCLPPLKQRHHEDSALLELSTPFTHTWKGSAQTLVVLSFVEWTNAPFIVRLWRFLLNYFLLWFVLYLKHSEYSLSDMDCFWMLKNSLCLCDNIK